MDQRLRDQISYKLGVDWHAITEFRPEEFQPHPNLCRSRHALARCCHPNLGIWPTRDWAHPLGPHREPLPENAAYLSDPLSWEPSNLVILYEEPATEEEQLAPDGYSAPEPETVEDQLALVKRYWFKTQGDWHSVELRAQDLKMAVAKKGEPSRKLTPEMLDAVFGK